MVLGYSKLQTHLSFGAQMQSKWTFGKALISPATSFHDQSEFIAFSQFSEYLTQETFISKGDLPLHLSTNKKQKTY